MKNSMLSLQLNLNGPEYEYMALEKVQTIM